MNNEKEEEFLNRIKEINSNISVYKIIDMIQEMNDTFKSNMVDFKKGFFANNKYINIKAAIEKQIEYNSELSKLISSNEHIYNAFKILYSSCSNGTFLIPSNEIMKKEQRNVINRLFAECNSLLKTHNSYVHLIINENEYKQLKLQVTKLDLYYRNIAVSKQNNPAIVINEVFSVLKEKLQYKKNVALKK